MHHMLEIMRGGDILFFLSFLFFFWLFFGGIFSSSRLENVMPRTEQQEEGVLWFLFHLT